MSDVKPDALVCGSPESLTPDLIQALRTAPLGETVTVPLGQPDTDRRVRIYTISANTVLDWFTAAFRGWAGQRFISLPVMEGVPPGVRVLSVVSNPLHRTFDLLLAHPSFDPVPEGFPTPVIHNGLWTSEVLAELVTPPHRL